MKKLLTIFFLIFAVGNIYGQDTPRGTATSCNNPNPITVYFKFGSSMVDIGYRENGQALTDISLLLTSGKVIDSISIKAYSSPDGVEPVNNKLAGDRARAMKGYLIWKYPNLNQHTIYTHASGEDWNGLREAVLADQNLPDKDKVLAIIDASVGNPTKKWRLQQLGNGDTYQYLQTHIFRSLRNAATCVVWLSDAKTTPQRGDGAGMGHTPTSGTEKSSILESETTSCAGTCCKSGEECCSKPEAKCGSTSGTGCCCKSGVECCSKSGTDPSEISTVVAQELSEVSVIDITISDNVTSPSSGPDGHASTEGKQKSKPKFAIKTNLLYDAVLLPNVEAELYFSQRWSFNFEVQGAWWTFKSHDRFYQLVSGGPEMRYWLKNDGLFNGHYFGAYLNAGLYDLKYSDIGYQGEFYGAGISWGYMMPLKKRLALEFGLGIGYMYTEYDKYWRYYPMGEHYVYDGTHRTSYFGPTKAKVGLVWRFE